MKKLTIPIHKVIIFSDAISTLLSLRRHPAIFQHPFRGWLAASGKKLFSVATMMNSQTNIDVGPDPITKESIAMFIDQNIQENFADYAT